jgi:nitroreductase
MINPLGVTTLSSVSGNERNQVLDLIIESRHSIRKFKPEMPPRELMKQVIYAGLLAPYSGIAVSRNDFRQFIVILRDSETTSQVAVLLKQKVVSMYEELERQMRIDSFLKRHGQAFYQNLRAMSQHGVPNIGKAPYYIVVAEQKGIPAVEQRSLAHCMQNMWLKSTALGLGFQLLSITAQMAEDKKFCDLLGICCGDFALDGCLIGYPDAIPPLAKRPQVDRVTKWID